MSVFKQFTFKVANMIKEQEFVIYPYDGGKYLHLQSDKRFIQLQLTTGRGIINVKNVNYANFIRLQMNPLPFIMPEEILEQIKDYLQNNSGRQSNGVIVIENKPLFSV